MRARFVPLTFTNVLLPRSMQCGLNTVDSPHNLFDCFCAQGKCAAFNYTTRETCTLLHSTHFVFLLLCTHADMHSYSTSIHPLNRHRCHDGTNTINAVAEESSSAQGHGCHYDIGTIRLSALSFDGQAMTVATGHTGNTQSRPPAPRLCRLSKRSGAFIVRLGWGGEGML